MVGETLVLSYLVDAKSRIELRTLTGELKQEVALPGIGVAHVGEGRKTETDVFLVFTNYTTPGTVYRLQVEGKDAGRVEVWRQPKLQFDPAAYVTTQVFCTSKDGTKVPLFITHKRGITMDGTAPAILYGVWRVSRCRWGPLIARHGWRGWRWGESMRRRFCGAAGSMARAGTWRGRRRRSRMSSMTLLRVRSS